jgi:ArsR family transcriptional regulator
LGVLQGYCGRWRSRIKILNRLIAADAEAVCVCEFVETLDLKQPTVSYHLKHLADAGLVLREKRGTYAYFRLAPGAFESVRELLTISPPNSAAAPAA